MIKLVTFDKKKFVFGTIMLFITLLLITLCLITTEYAIRYFRYNENGWIQNAAREFHLNYDPSNKDLAVLTLRKNDLNVFPFVKMLSPYNGLMPLGNVPDSTMVYCNEMGPWFVIKSDHLGFHNQEDDYKPSIKAMFVGDSFTQGACDPLTKGFVSLIKTAQYKQNPSRGILNFGMGSNGPMEELATVREYAPHFKPEIIIWAYSDANDLENMRNTQDHPLLSLYKDRSFRQDLLSKTVQIRDDMIFVANNFIIKDMNPALVPTTNDFIFSQPLFWQRSELLSFIKELLFGEKQREIKTDYMNMAQLVALAKRDADDIGAKFYFVFIPDGRLSMKQTKEHIHEVRTLIEEAHIPFIDLTHVLTEGCGYFDCYAFGRHGGHFNPKGNKVVADYLLKLIFPIPTRNRLND